MSVFSDLNNLRNITLTPEFGSLARITQKKLETNISEEIVALQNGRPDILTQIEDWYDGYTWDKDILRHTLRIQERKWP